MNNLVHRFDRWLFDPHPIADKHLSLYRIFFCLLIFFRGPLRFGKIADYSPDLFDPKNSLAVWFDLPPLLFFESLDVVISIFLVLMLFGWKTAWVSRGFALLQILGASFLFSFGKIDHADLLIIFLPLVMSFSGWGRYYSLDAKDTLKEESLKWPISVMSLIIGFAMFTAGIKKLLGGWLDTDFRAIEYHILRSKLGGREGPLNDFMFAINTPFTWEVMDYLIVVFEIGFLVAVFLPRVFSWWVRAAILFHVGVYLVIDISFDKNLIAYFLFLGWPILVQVSGFDKLLETLKRFVHMRSMFFALLVMIALNVFNYSPYLIRLLPVPLESGTMVIYTMAVVAMTISVLFRKRYDSMAG